MPDIVEDAAGIAGAVTGQGTPDNVSVKRPVKSITVGIFAVLIAMLLLVAGLAIDLSQGWGWPESTAPQRINFLGYALVIAQVCVGVLVVALAGFGRVEAKAGMAEIKVGN